MNAPTKFPDRQDTVWAPANFTDDEFEDLIGELSRIGRFELRDYEIYRVNTRLDPEALADPAFAPAEFTDNEFENLIGALGRMGRFELRNWKLYRMNAQHAPHARAKMLLVKALDRAIEVAGVELEVLSEVSVRFGNGFAPDPDIVLWRPTNARKAIPGDRIELIAEISDTTLTDDLGRKRESYAETGLREYWVADLSARVIHQFAEPRDGAFARAAQVRFGERVASLNVPQLVADTAALIRF